MKIGKKHIILFVIAIALLIVGYKYNEFADILNGGSNQEAFGGTAGATGNKTDGNVGNNVGANTNTNTDANTQSTLYFSKNRLDRDVARSKTKETFEVITKDEKANPNLKSEAYEKIITMAEAAALETKIEGLIREKGFNDAFVEFNEQGDADVLINAPSLNEQQVTQITDIIVRQSELDYKNIYIRRVA